MDNQEIKLPFFHSLRGRLLLWFLLLALVPLIIVGVLAYWQAQGALREMAFEELRAVQAIKKDQIEEYFVEHENDMTILMEMVKAFREEAFAKLDAVQETKKNQVEEFFAQRYGDIALLAERPDMLALYEALKAYHDEREVGATAPFPVNTAEYEELIAEYGDFLLDYLEVYGYYDIYLICTAHGHVMFTGAGRDDLGANLSSGKLKDSNLAKLWREVRETKDIAVVDFAPYAPANNEQAMFIGAPIRDRADNIVGIVALQIPDDKINAIVQERTGMGKTGETYLITEDDAGRISFRSDMITMGDGEYVIGADVTDIATEYIYNALRGETDRELFLDSAGSPVLVSYAPLRLEGLNWAIISKIDLEEALIPQMAWDAEGKDFFTRYKEQYGYRDLFLINPDGFILYTVLQEEDYHTNILTGPYSDSNLGALVKQVLENKQFGIADFAPYAPNNNIPTAFVAYPLVDNTTGTAHVELVVATQFLAEDINAVMQERTGMGDTGETYLVGPNKRMRSDSYLNPTTHSVEASFAGTVEQNGVDTVASRAALAGRGGTGIIDDYRGAKVISAYAPLQIAGLNWAIIAEIDRAEAFAAVYNLRNAMLIIAVIAVIIVVGVSLRTASSLANPIVRITEVARAVTNGNLEITADVETKDETGILANSFNQMIGQLRDMLRKERKRVDSLRQLIMQVQKSAARVAVASEQLNSSAEQTNSAVAQIAQIIQQVAQGTAEQTQGVTDATGNSEQIARAADGIARGAQEQAESVQNTSALMTEVAEFIADVHELAGSVSGAGDKVKQTALSGVEIVTQTSAGISSVQQRTAETTARIREMNDRSREIGRIVETIDEIADKTDMLALNAAVEAARAGEHGRGFAVVADQVRKLSEDAKTATRDIAELISRMQEAVSEAINAVEAVGDEVNNSTKLAQDTVDALEEIQQATATSTELTLQITAAVEEVQKKSDGVIAAMEAMSAVVEENTAAAEEMSASSREVTDSMENVASIAEENSAATEEVSASTEEMSAQMQEVVASAEELASMAEQLRAAVADFEM